MTIWRTLIDAETLSAQMAAEQASTEQASTEQASTEHASMEHASTEHVVVFDCRFSLADAQAGEAAWRQSRIPGARYAHLNRDLSDLRSPHVPDSGRHPWPKADVFAAWLARQGVTAQTQVVAYDAGDGAYAARLWCLLHALGHEAVAVLDGGWARWGALGLPVDDTPPTEQDAARSQFDAAPIGAARFDRRRLFEAREIPERLTLGDVLIDARAAERFRGEAEPIDRVAGHVPGAVNRPYAMNLEDGRFKSRERLIQEFGALLGARPSYRVVAMCGSGVTACHHLLAMEHAGLTGAALFTGSWSGWIEDPSRPVAASI
jgi:thiosulfate/3-mercaptopyruvate sulfurtransferase